MMTLLSSIWSKIAGYAIAVGGVLAVLAAAYAKGRSDQKSSQTKDKLAAAEDLLEMDREATAAEREAGALSDAEARREAEKWAK